MLHRSLLLWRLKSQQSFVHFSAKTVPQFRQGKTEYAWRSIAHAPVTAPVDGALAATTSGSSAGGENMSNVVTSSSAHQPFSPVIIAEECFQDRMKILGMPKGYPHTCAPGFARYFYISVTASFVGNFATSIATQTLLGGFFADASPQIWMLKDLAPAILAAFIANKVVSYEGRPKFWLVVCAVLTNTAVMADMFIPSLIPPQYLLAAAVITSMVKQSALLMFFVARACALQHFATHQNLAEFTKKFNSFGMVMYTVATALGIAFTSVVHTFEFQLIAVLLGCLINTVLSYTSMAPIAFRVVNPITGMLIMRQFVASRYTSVPTPDEVSQILGVRGTVNPRGYQDFTDMISISPKIASLDIQSHQLEQTICVGNTSSPFALALWNVRSQSLVQRVRRSFRPRSKSERMFGPNLRLVVLIGSSCDNKSLFCAHLMAYAAAMEDHRSLDEMKSFLRDCSTNHKLWMQKTELLLLHMKNKGWDTNALALDPMEMRISFMSDRQTTTAASDLDEAEEE